MQCPVFLRYAVKLMYDEAVLGEVCDNAELTEYLIEYDTEWYIGCEGDQEWRACILSETPHLFSMGADKEKVQVLCHNPSTDY